MPNAMQPDSSFCIQRSAFSVSMEPFMSNWNRYNLIGWLLGLLCCCSAFTTMAQTADFSMNKNEGCIPLGGVNFTDLSSGGSVVRRDWNLGNGTIINNGAATVGTNYLTAGTFTVSLTVTFAN